LYELDGSWEQFSNKSFDADKQLPWRSTTIVPDECVAGFVLCSCQRVDMDHCLCLTVIVHLVSPE